MTADCISRPLRRPGTPVRSRADDATLVRSWRERRDRRAYEELVSRYEPLAASIARRYARSTSEPYEDLRQVAYVGLLGALKRFDPERGVSLQTFAVPTITGHIRRHFRDAAWAIHVPRGAKNRVRELRRAIDEAASELGRSPAIVELADRLETTSEEVLEVLEAQQCFRTYPLEPPPPDDDDPGLAPIGAEDEGYREVEDRLALERALGALPERERQVVALRFREELTQAEIARRLGCSQMQVSRLLRKALGRMRALALHGGTPEAWVA